MSAEVIRAAEDIAIVAAGLWIFCMAMFCAAVWHTVRLAEHSDAWTVDYTTESSEGPQEASVGDYVEMEE